MRRLSILIPCFNEEKTIEVILNILEKVQLGVEKEIIIVDDGSTDRTPLILKKYQNRHKVIFLKKNKGKGAAIKIGFKYITGDYVIIQDADLEYNPEDILKFVDLVNKKQALVVYGFRHFRQWKTDDYLRWYYYLGGKIITKIANLLYSINISDELVCYKMLHKSVLNKITICSNGFEWESEITAKIARLKIPIYEVPISYIPRSRHAGKKIKAKDGFLAIWILIKYKFTK